MRILLFLALILLFSGCYPNERGISRNYYSDCKEYYDANGIYHKTCPKNYITFPDKL